MKMIGGILLFFVVAVSCLSIASCRNENKKGPSQLERDIWVQCESAKMRSKDLLKDLAQDPDKAFGPAMEMGLWLSLCGPAGKEAKEGIERAFLANNGPDVFLLEKSFQRFSGS